MDNIKLFATNKKELETLIQIMRLRIYFQDIGMDFGIEKCAMLKMRNYTDGRIKPMKPRKNQNARRKGKLQILGNIGSGRHQINVDERKIQRLSLQILKVPVV